jgi:CRISPR-associated endonuclease/helicase Cas3
MQDGIELSATAAYQSCDLSYIPNPMQEEMYRSITSGDCTILLKAPTGSGKTEAIVVPALMAQRRTVLIYPALSLIEDQEMRIEKMLEHLSVTMPKYQRSLIVDTGADMRRRVWVKGKEQHPQRPERRHLYHGDIILTTIDKFLYRFFGFGEPKKSYIYPLRLRYGRQPLFCFDEAHSYDEVAYTNFVDLVRAIGFNADAPRDIVVMTATMPSEYEIDLLPMLTPIDYTSGERKAALENYYTIKAGSTCFHPEKHFKYISAPVKDQVAFRQQMLTTIEKLHRPGLRTIVTVEEIRTAVPLYKELMSRMSQNVLLYHGRQTHEIRRRVYKRLKELEATDQGYILVTTSAIEVGCDLNAHLLLTQLCNPEQLVQRAGRCNRRREMSNAYIVVIGDHIPDYLCTLPDSSVERYKSLLQQMAKEEIFTPDYFSSIERKHQLPDYRVQTMFAMLYEYVYQAERANKPLHDKGLVITRSWEPTLTLTTGYDDSGKAQNALQISMQACSTGNIREIDSQCEIFVRHYDDNAEQYILEPPKYGGCAYHQDIVLCVPETYFDPVIGYEHVPKAFLRSGSRQGYRRWLCYSINSPQIPTSKKGTRTGSLKSAAEVSDTNSKVQETVWWWYLEKLPSSNEDTSAPEINTEDDVHENEDSSEEDTKDE